MSLPRRAWSASGTFLFWLTWPLMWVYCPLFLRCRVIVIAEGKVLVVKGWLGPARWSLPGGGKHASESEAAAAARELVEETGIEARASDLQLLFANHSFIQNGLKVRYSCFLLALPSTIQPKIQVSEIVDAAWLTPAELAKQKCGGDVVAALAAWHKRF